MYGIFVNEDGGIPYADAIVRGIKTIETRNRNMLSPLVWARVAVVRTRRGKSPSVLGYVDIVGATYLDGVFLDQYRNKTLIPVGSKHDNNGHGKWCYFLANPEKLDKPQDLPENVVRHGRSWCEWEEA